VHPDDAARRFGDFIRAQRQLANLSLRHLAKLSNVSDSYLSQVERGLYRPSPDVVKAIADGLGLAAPTLYHLIGWFEGPPAADVQPVPHQSVEAAISEDERLSTEQKSALLHLYRTLVAAG